MTLASLLVALYIGMVLLMLIPIIAGDVSRWVMVAWGLAYLLTSISIGLIAIVLFVQFLHRVFS